MALVLANRVQESATANTTVSFTLAGPISGFQSFAVIGDTNTTYYAAADASGNWEVGLGTYSSPATLTRTTVYASSNSGNAVTFSGTVNVFVTYPSGKSVNLDTAGNVSSLGTVSSGTWQGSTVGVAYGGTGVTTSSGANSVMLRDADQNVAVNRLNQSNTSTSAAGGTTALTAASSYAHTLIGTGSQTYTMPDATTLATGVAFVFNNMATGTLTLQNYAAGAIGTIPTGGAGTVFLTDNSTTGGIWDIHAYLPEGVTFGTNAFNLGTSVISGGTWQGGTIQPGYGGTGLTTFVGANNALYSTGATTLTAGTLPVAAGGSGATTLTGYVYGNGTSAFTASTSIPNSATTATSANTPSAIVARDASGDFSAGTITANLTGTASSATSATSATTATNLAAGVAGAIPYQSGAGTTAFSAAGTAGQLLQSNGGSAPTWVTPSYAPLANPTFTGTVSVNGNTNLGNSATGQTYTTRISGYGVDDGGLYGSYGTMIVNATSAFTSGARRYMITNALSGNTFAIIRSTDATTDPAIGSAGNLSSGTVDFAMSNTGNVGIGTASPFANLHVNGSTGILTRQSSLQDGVAIVGRAGGTGEFEVTITPTTLTADRTLTLPDATTTVVGTTVTQTLTNKTITGLLETKGSLTFGTTLVLDSGNWFATTITGTTTFSVANVPANNTAISFVFDITNGGSATINWWTGVKWPGGAAPALTVTGRDVLGFFTYDGGTTWTGLLLGKDVK